MPEQSNDYRVVVFGAGGVGKSSLVLRFVKGTFRDTYIPTVEDTYRQVISCDKSVCTLEITDTTGSHQFPAMQRLSISKGHAFILVYSITSRQSLEELKPIYQQVLAIKGNVEGIPIMLVGNKSDETQREVETREGEAQANHWKCAFMETSAKTNHNVTELFQELLNLDKKRDMSLNMRSSKQRRADKLKAKCSVMQKSPLSAQPARLACPASFPDELVPAPKPLSMGLVWRPTQQGAAYFNEVAGLSDCSQHKGGRKLPGCTGRGSANPKNRWAQLGCELRGLTCVGAKFISTTVTKPPRKAMCQQSQDILCLSEDHSGWQNSMSHKAEPVHVWEVRFIEIELGGTADNSGKATLEVPLQYPSPSSLLQQLEKRLCVVVMVGVWVSFVTDTDSGPGRAVVSSWAAETRQGGGSGNSHDTSCTCWAYYCYDGFAGNAPLARHFSQASGGVVGMYEWASGGPFASLRHSFGQCRQFEIRDLTRDWRTTLAAARISQQLEVNEAGTKVRRRCPVPDWLLCVPTTKLLLAWNFLGNTTEGTESGGSGAEQQDFMEAAMCVFGLYGTITSLRILRPGKEVPAELRRYAKKHAELGRKLCAVVEFEYLDGARKAYEALGVAEQQQGGKGIRVALLGSRGTRKSVCHGEESEESIENDGSKKPNRKAKRHLYSMEDSALYSSSESDFTPASPRPNRRVSRPQALYGSPLAIPRASAFCSDPYRNPLGSPVGSPLLPRKLFPGGHAISPLATPPFSSTPTSVGSATYSRNKCSADYTQDSTGNVGSPWVQRRKNAAQALHPEKSCPLSPSHVKRSLGVLVMRQPQGPDGTKGFHNSIGRGKVLLP
ncbi:hypothetical protein P4O66_001956 [Electrophorus voltai]|nr:hypothetical protein P4O66_001956 [Electrophorus voltai]